jgi:thiamine kinase-like enzyme
VRQLHRSDAQFPTKFDLLVKIDRCLALLAGTNVGLPDGYHDVAAEAEGVRATLAASPARLTACHWDPLCENFLDAGASMWIVDRDYSVTNHPMWDLDDLSVEAGSTQGRTTNSFTPPSTARPAPPTVAGW